MDAHLFASSTITLFFILITVPISRCDDDEHYTECSRSHTCGGVNLGIYPFWGGERPQFCGLQGFQLECHENQYPVINIKSQRFRVLEINQSGYTMRIARVDLWEDICLDQFENTTLNYTLFRNLPMFGNLSILYGCPPEVPWPEWSKFKCTVNGRESVNLLVNEDTVKADFKNLTRCGHRVDVPISWTVMGKIFSGAMNLQEAFREGFEVAYEADGGACGACAASDGVCGYNLTEGEFSCLCRDRPYSTVCSRSGNKRDWTLKVVIGVVAAIVGGFMMCVFFIIYQRRKQKRYVSSVLLSRNISSFPSSMPVDVEKGGTYLGLHIFTYSELEEATNNFDSSKELGDGGFGTVYHGKLRDGRFVAVKRLFENNCRRVEQFMNEVEILTRLHHQNLVTLYGCTSRHSRELLLVYEYIPNGTVADHLHGERAKSCLLTWPIRMSISIETANALSYLHASDIIHRDVKTNNILLDNNFCVKVADFGLSRLFPTDVTHISTAPQGTPGYLDPEYHQCYQLTDKSDVYSFGVVLIELISSKPAVDITRHRHDINLSNMAIHKIQNHALHELVDPCLGFETDHKVRRMITAVAELAFQCLQNEKDMRPSMEEVLGALEGIRTEADKVQKAEELDKPLLLSPDTVTAEWNSRSTTPNASS